MGKPTNSKKPENHVGKGKVTPVQVAFIVDRYLSDNTFTQTRSTFRSEASSLISKTNVKEAPKSLMSLDAILDEYICLKEQKVLLEQEKQQVEKEKYRVEILLQGMQSVMQAYNNSSNTATPPPLGSVPNAMDLVPKPNPILGTPSGNTPNVTPTMKSIPWFPNATPTMPSTSWMPTNISTMKSEESTNFTTPSNNLPSRSKRKSPRSTSAAPTTAKRPCRQATRKTLSASGNKTLLQAQNTNSSQGMAEHTVSAIQSSQTNSADSCLASGSSVRESSVAKNLFKQSSSPLQSSSPSPKTPPQECTSQVDHTISPLENSSHVNSTFTNTALPENTPNCVISSSTKTVMLSPSKHIACYSVERSHYFSSPAKSHVKRPGTTRDHVKGRLDFGASDVPIGSDQTVAADIPVSGSEDDIFDMDIPDFDMFGADFSISEFLVDMGIECGQDRTPASDISGSPHESGFENSDAIQSFSEFSEILHEKDMNVPGHDPLASVKSVRKCITISSPAKNRRSSALDQENLRART